jgi:nucleoid DNA-binding protein
MATRELTTDGPNDVVRQVFETVTDVLLREGRVEIRGFGTFELVRRKARKARNPRTGSHVDVPATTVVRFKPSRLLKDRAAPITEVS